MPRNYRHYDLSDYEVTREGEVINKHNGKHIKPQLNGKGYLRVGIGGKLMFVHRLVAEQYIPNLEGKPQINHKDGNKLNNNVDNLEWVTNQENRNHAVKDGLQTHGDSCTWAKLSKEKVEFIRNHPEISNQEFAKLFNVSRLTVSDARRLKTWKN